MDAYCVEVRKLEKHFGLAKAIEFIKDIMHRFGMPNRIIMDLGSPFTTIEFKSWAQDCGINIDYASVMHTEANE